MLKIFYQAAGHFSRNYNCCSHVQLLPQVWLFLWCFWSNDFPEKPLSSWWCKTYFFVGEWLHVLTSIFLVSCCYAGVDSHILHQLWEFELTVRNDTFQCFFYCILTEQVNMGRSHIRMNCTWGFFNSLLEFEYVCLRCPFIGIQRLTNQPTIEPINQSDEFKNKIIWVLFLFDPSTPEMSPATIWHTINF